MTTVTTAGDFDDIRSSDLRFLQEASRRGRLRVRLRSDEAIRRRRGRLPKFPQEERLYFLRAIRCVEEAALIDDEFGEASGPPDLWIAGEGEDGDAAASFCRERGIDCLRLPASSLEGFPEWSDAEVSPENPRPKVIVTGCYDWLHSGHVRFFEEASSLGDLYVAAGNDANVRHLKGEGHPLFPQEERRYMVGAIRYVHRALVTSGSGWLDAEPEIERIRPDFYVVNEDGDRPEKRDYCAAHGIDYKVLKRLPKEGLPRRQSTDLRGY